jgi:hypothetical protein
MHKNSEELYMDRVADIASPSHHKPFTGRRIFRADAGICIRAGLLLLLTGALQEDVINRLVGEAVGLAKTG